MGGDVSGLRLFYYKPLISGFGEKPWSKQPLFRSKLPSLRLGIATPPPGLAALRAADPEGVYTFFSPVSSPWPPPRSGLSPLAARGSVPKSCTPGNSACS